MIFVLGQEPDWGQQSTESLPSYSFNTPHTNSYPNLNGAKSLDNLVASTSVHLTTVQDPFNTAQYWSEDQPTVDRPNDDLHLDASTSQSSQSESQIYSANNYSINTNFNSIGRNNDISSNESSYNNFIQTTVPMEQNNVSNVVTSSLANMSLDDRISESLNLRSKNENVYINTTYNNVPSTSSVQNHSSNDKYNDIPIYNNFDINPAHQQFILETKDYYTKLSTPSKTNSSNNYEKNIYVPKYEDEVEKLQNFSDNVENSKNYSAMKYQNVEYEQYGYGGYGGNYASTSQAGALYDEVNDTASNVYSEISEPTNTNLYGAQQAIYTNAALYDEVYDETPRPHRPAPPCPTKPK